MKEKLPFANADANADVGLGARGSAERGGRRASIPALAPIG